MKKVNGQTYEYVAKYMGRPMDMWPNIWRNRKICGKIDGKTDEYVARYIGRQMDMWNRSRFVPY